MFVGKEFKRFNCQRVLFNIILIIFMMMGEALGWQVCGGGDQPCEEPV